jgi:hypothetical protein
MNILRAAKRRAALVALGANSEPQVRDVEDVDLITALLDAELCRRYFNEDEPPLPVCCWDCEDRAAEADEDRSWRWAFPDLPWDDD